MYQRTKAMLLLLLVLLSLSGWSQTGTPTSYTILLSLPDQSIISNVSPTGVPTFTLSAINSTFSSYNVTGFKKAYPNSRFGYMRDIYTMRSNSANLGPTVKSSWPQYFTHYEIKKETKLLGEYRPSDYTAGIWDTGYLYYINAPVAWGISKGDPGTLIGVTDGYFNLSNPDLVGKFTQASNNYPPSDPKGSESWNHGSLVAGLAAGRTDNGNTGYASIGFNCRLVLDQDRGSESMLRMVKNQGCQVVNGSWGGPEPLGTTADEFISNNLSQQQNWQEIYENGGFSVAAAGNGGDTALAALAHEYFLPASFDHVFSVTSCGWMNPHGGSDPFNVQGVHEITIGDTDEVFNHNDRVDLMAPGIQIGGLDCDTIPSTINFNWSHGWGTSFAAPLVAGTAGLMHSVNPCLSPYQLEYLLKFTANAMVLGYSENQPYSGLLGAGVLDAGNALTFANPVPGNPEGNCNNTGTQTMKIEGYEINTVCAPGFASNGAIPKLKPVIKNGTPPYTARWIELPGNETTLSDLHAVEPEVTASTGDRLLHYRLTIYDSSPIAQKVADKIIKVQLTTYPAYDLAVRDAYEDPMDEPSMALAIDSVQWNIWKSPDIWVRHAADGGTEHQDPEYSTTDSNYIYVRIRNVGCIPFNHSNAGAGVRLYWTKASTGERWTTDWTGGTFVPGSTSPSVVAGGQIGQPLLVPDSLQPGTSTILRAGWMPARPDEFAGDPYPTPLTEVDACILARVIESRPMGPWGGWVEMPLNETTGSNVKRNVVRNNNIATKNLLIVNLEADRPKRRQIWVGNAESAAHNFTLQFINDRAIHKHLAGDFSAIGFAKLYLGTLFDRWLAAGAKGSYTSINREEKTVTFDGTSTVELSGISFGANERLPVVVEFKQHSGIELDGELTFGMHIRQFLENDKGEIDPDVYGNVSFEVNTGRKTTAEQRRVQSPIEKAATSTVLTVYPNPANDELNMRSSRATGNAVLTLTDITGRNLYTENINLSAGVPHHIPVSGLTPGVYIVHLRNASGYDERTKFIKE